MTFGREELLTYAREQFGTEPEYLWARYPNFCVLRHIGNRKWYAAVMDVPKNRLGLSGDETVSIVDVKCDPRMLGSALESNGYLPAYHMNKANWITILLDGSVTREEVIHMLTLSYDLTRKKR